MRALARLAWGEGIPDCTRCKKDEFFHEVNGCGDEPSQAPLYRVTCSACRGDGCERCEGKGTFPMYRCPRKLVAERPDVVGAFTLFVEYDAHGVLPVLGGYMEQSAFLVDAWAAARSEKNAIDHERALEERRAQHAAQKKAEKGRRMSSRG